MREFADRAISHADATLARLNASSAAAGGPPVELPFVHGHYADAGEAAALVAATLGVDMVLTGHSLGRNKLDHLLKSRERLPLPACLPACLPQLLLGRGFFVPSPPFISLPARGRLLALSLFLPPPPATPCHPLSSVHQETHASNPLKSNQRQTGTMGRREIEAAYAMSRRIEAEERGLDAAALVFASTRQEVREQWGLYDG